MARKNELDKVGRWNCHACKSSFNVLPDTIMQKTKIPLQTWFLAIGAKMTSPPQRAAASNVAAG